MTTGGWVEVAFGLAMILATFYDLFRSIVLPRPSVNRFLLVRLLFIGVWSMWRWVGRRLSGPARREPWLATLGTPAVLTMFAPGALPSMPRYAPRRTGLRPP